MAYRTLDSGLGFSLKPPKWIRKAQPGKVLAKALPIAAVGAALFIPGAAPLALSAAKKLGSGVLKLGKAVVSSGAKQVTAQLPQQLNVGLPMNSVPSGDVSSGMPQTQSTPYIAPPSGAGPEAPASSTGGGSGDSGTAMPGWLIPAGIAAVAFMVVSSRRRN